MIRYYRKSRRMNQNELSKKSNIDVYLIRRIEHGEVSPTLDQVCKLATALGVNEYKLVKELLSNREKHMSLDSLYTNP